MLAQHSLRNAEREFPASLSQNTKIIQWSLHKWPYSPRAISLPTKLIPLPAADKVLSLFLFLAPGGGGARAVGAARKRGTDIQQRREGRER